MNKEEEYCEVYKEQQCEFAGGSFCEHLSCYILQMYRMHKHIDSVETRLKELDTLTLKGI